MDERAEAVRDLARIRDLMERAGRYSHLSGLSALLAGLLGAAGAVACLVLRIDFNYPGHAPRLAAVWGAVLALAAGQHLGWTVLQARRRGEPAWSSMARQVALAQLPSLFIGAAITGFGLQTGQLDLLPPVWALAHGSSLLALGLWAGGRIQGAGVLFLATGAATLWWMKEHGVWMMLVAFGGYHVALGAWMLWKPRE
ncbi:MAG TPA: hypothetical protein VF950_21110 [Planctomycetota bacterium]